MELGDQCGAQGTVTSPRDEALTSGYQEETVFSFFFHPTTGNPSDSVLRVTCGSDWV